MINIARMQVIIENWRNYLLNGPTMSRKKQIAYIAIFLSLLQAPLSAIEVSNFLDFNNAIKSKESIIIVHSDLIIRDTINEIVANVEIIGNKHDIFGQNTFGGLKIASGIDVAIRNLNILQSSSNDVAALTNYGNTDN